MGWICLHSKKKKGGGFNFLEVPVGWPFPFGGWAVKGNPGGLSLVSTFAILPGHSLLWEHPDSGVSPNTILGD